MPPSTPTATPADPEIVTDARSLKPRIPWDGYALAAAGAILFSAKGILIKLAYAENVDTETLLALRMGLALPVYVAIGALALARSGRPAALDARTAAAALAVGLLGYWFASYTDFLGLAYISAPFERLILFTYPLFTVLLGAAFFRQPFRPGALAAFGLSYAGLALVFLKDMEAEGLEATRAGALLVLASALAFALYQLFAKGLIARLGPKLFTCLAMLAAAAGALVQFLIVRDLSALGGLSPRAWALAAALALFATVLPSFLLSAALHRISAQANAAIGTVSPIATLALAVLFLGERATPMDLAGAALVLAGVGWFTLSDRRR
ncbi:permease [Methylopila jiangsuensis]|uniref:Permease n=1 Tax=Methylopila jiangsuensis TaxID=586230 RepID=A0A9W6JFC4_9HYPH|nr:DMT family transporter [Methylopila jiangsuensis]MDR6287403.1 drug/metabolite transporter (DMT)-like permease [Methylopila jiangsuensis]GLK74984.1 permease [Methylopila jiangsuensis]